MRLPVAASLAVLLALAACGNAPPSRPARFYSNEAQAKCAYEARKAFAGARERSIGDSIDNAVQEAKLRQMCLETM